MATRFQEKFGCDVEALKNFAKNLHEYNKQLERVYLAMIEEIQTRSIGKEINNVFTKRVMAALGDKVKCDISAGYAAYSGEKAVKIRLTDFGVFPYDYSQSLTTEIKFNHENHYEKAAATKDNRFIDDSVSIIVNTINSNRRSVADYEDAAEKAEKQIEKVAKAVNDFLRVMESVNPMFVDTQSAMNLSYNKRKNVKPFDYDAYDEKRYAKAKLFELPKK